LSEYLFPVYISLFQLRSGAVCPVGASDCCSHSKASLSEIQSDADFPADTVVRHPFDVFHIYATLVYQIFKQSPNRIIDNGSNYRGTFTEAAFQTPTDVILAAAFPGAKVAGRMYPFFTGVQSNHDFAQRYDVVFTFSFGFDVYD
jgi:hypothetical protein